MTAHEMVEQSRESAAISELDSVTCEIAVIEATLRDGTTMGIKDLVIFSDCKPAIARIDNAVNGTKDHMLLKLIAETIGEYDSMQIVWVPGHCGIVGNYQAHRTAKRMINTRIDYGRWAG
jgi:ribonuclease HI